MMFRKDGTKIVMPKGRPKRKGMKARRPSIATTGGDYERTMWLRGK